MVTRRCAASAFACPSCCSCFSLATASLIFLQLMFDGGLAIDYDASFLAAEYEEVKCFHDLRDRRAYFDVSRRGRGVELTCKDRIEVWRAFEAYDELKAKRNLVDRYELINDLTRYLNGDGERPFRHLVADEVQDFTNVELRLLRTLVPENLTTCF